MIPYRFSFLFSFVLLYMAYRGWLLRRRFRAAHILAAALLTAGVLCCSGDLLTTQGVDFLDGTLEIPVYILYNLGFLIAFTGALLYGALHIPVPEDPTPEALADLRFRQHRSAGADPAAAAFFSATAVCPGCGMDEPVP